MPISITQTAASNISPMNPFVGTIGHTAAVSVTLSGLTTAEVDANGYLKPGVPFSIAGALVGSTVAVFGVTQEAIKVAASNGSSDLTAAGTKRVVVATIGQVNRKLMEDSLGRTLTANEIAGFGLAPCTIKLLA